jgi:hypothetical protein
LSYARASGCDAKFATGKHRQRTGNGAVRPNRDPISRTITGGVARPGLAARRLALRGAVGYGSAQRDVAQLG